MLQNLFSLSKRPALTETLPTQVALSAWQAGGVSVPVVRTRRQKSIALKSLPGGVVLHVPGHLSQRALQALLLRHSQWIEDRYKALERQRTPRFECVPGAQLRYLGECYELQWRAAETPGCRLAEKSVWLSGPSPATKEGRSEAVTLLQSWYLRQARDYFSRWLPHYAERVGVEVKQVSVKTYKARWGSCYSDGRIQFNWKLMQAPAWVIDYVIVHELCHLHHANHSAAFWACVAQHYPQSAEAKRWLKQHGADLMQFLS